MAVSIPSVEIFNTINCQYNFDFSIGFSMKEIPYAGYKTFPIEKGKRQDAEISVCRNYCDNQFYTIQLGKGGITKLFDKALVKDVFNTTAMVADDVHKWDVKPTHEKNKNAVCQAVGKDIIGVAIEILKYF